MIKVIVTVSGGVVTGVYANSDEVKAEVLDYDNEEEGSDFIVRVEREKDSMKSVLV